MTDLSVMDNFAWDEEMDEAYLYSLYDEYRHDCRKYGEEPKSFAEWEDNVL